MSKHIYFMLRKPVVSFPSPSIVRVILAFCGSFPLGGARFVRATPVVISMCPRKLKSRKKSWNMWVWLSKNGFGLAFLHTSLRLVKRTAIEECREYDRPLLPVSDCPILMTGPGALLLVQSSLSPVCSRSWCFAISTK